MNEVDAINFEERYKEELHLVDRSPPFIRNKVHRPQTMRFEKESGRTVGQSEQKRYEEVRNRRESLANSEAWVARGRFRKAHKTCPPEDMFNEPSKFIIHALVTSCDLDV